MESIMDGLRRRLRAVDRGQWEEIAREARVAVSMPRKVVYGDRKNPGVEHVQRLLDALDARDRAAVERGRAATRRHARVEA